MHRSLAFALVVTLLARPLRSQESARELHLELALGTAWNWTTPLIVRVPGQPTMRHRAHYGTRPWSDAPYYALRLGRSSTTRTGTTRGYDAELLHHKLYLENPPPAIERFEVSHGYNMVSVGALRPAGRSTLRIAVGVVIAHPEGRIADQPVGGSRRSWPGGGYHFAGLSAQLSLSRSYDLHRGRTSPYLRPEIKVTASTARVPLGDDGGTIFVPNVAVHALAGLGLRRSPR